MECYVGCCRRAYFSGIALGVLAGQLGSVENWSQRLWQAEEQQLAFARIFLAKPAVVFLDDATSASGNKLQSTEQLKN
jgi:vitamin B12/bleomycin/antimicrobial peptide transport system ATP-binding/permease protein